MAIFEHPGAVARAVVVEPNCVYALCRELTSDAYPHLVAVRTHEAPGMQEHHADGSGHLDRRSCVYGEEVIAIDVEKHCLFSVRRPRRCGLGCHQAASRIHLRSAAEISAVSG